jgi:hypothetical protein
MALDFELALSVATRFRFQISEAREQIERTRKIVGGLRGIARNLKILSDEIETMAPAFKQ